MNISAQDSRNQITANVARNWIHPPLSISMTIGLHVRAKHKTMDEERTGKTQVVIRVLMECVIRDKANIGCILSQ